MKSHKLRLSLFAMCMSLLVACMPGVAQAQLFCIFDPLGASGDYYSLFKDYQLAAKRWGVGIDLRPYSDDEQLDRAFKSGECDMASMIGMRVRTYNLFTSTLDAPGVIENYSQERDVMRLMASTKLAPYMTHGEFEVVGAVPVGAAYPIVNDRGINSLKRGAGKRVATMSWDLTQEVIARYFKLTPVPTDLPNMGKVFNSNGADMVVVPIVVYKALELEKGVGSNGGIVRRPLFEFTMQVVAHASKFPASFGQSSREYMLSQVDHALGIIRNQEAAVDNRAWIYAAHNEISEWDSSMRGLVEHMTKSGYYDSHMLGLLKRLRCKTDLEEPECAPRPDLQQKAVTQ